MTSDITSPFPPSGNGGYVRNLDAIATNILQRLMTGFVVQGHICVCVYIYILYIILPNILGHPLLMKGLTTLVIFMNTNLNV